MKYRIVQMVDDCMVVTSPTDIIAWANVAGVHIVGYASRKVLRAELQGQPFLEKFAGPMWDGDAVRYEDQRSNDTLSA